jgi:hypothetical protein
MVGIVGAWSFFSFIFFKVIIDLGMDNDITVFAALLMSIVFGGMFFVSCSVYATRLLYINAEPGSQSANLGEIIKKTIWPFLLFCVGFIISGRLIVLGFSKRLDREISRWDIGEEGFFWFCIFITIPIIAHYLMILFSTYQNTKRQKDHANPEKQRQNSETDNQPTNLCFKFKSGQAFFEYWCRNGFTNIEKNREIVAIVLDLTEELQTKQSVKIEKDGRQTVILRVASKDGGFIIPASTPSEKGDRLQPGDVVLWAPLIYNENMAKAFGHDRAGWMGFIRAKVLPEIDFEKNDFEIICEYN